MTFALANLISNVGKPWVSLCSCNDHDLKCVSCTQWHKYANGSLYLGDDLQHIAGAALVVQLFSYPQVAPGLIFGGCWNSASENEVSSHCRIFGRQELAIHAPAEILRLFLRGFKGLSKFLL